MLFIVRTSSSVGDHKSSHDHATVLQRAWLPLLAGVVFTIGGLLLTIKAAPIVLGVGRLGKRTRGAPARVQRIRVLELPSAGLPAPSLAGKSLGARSTARTVKRKQNVASESRNSTAPVQRIELDVLWLVEKVGWEAGTR